MVVNKKQRALSPLPSLSPSTSPTTTASPSRRRRTPWYQQQPPPPKYDRLHLGIPCISIMSIATTMLVIFILLINVWQAFPMYDCYNRTQWMSPTPSSSTSSSSLSSNITIDDGSSMMTIMTTTTALERHILAFTNRESLNTSLSWNQLCTLHMRMKIPFVEVLNRLTTLGQSYRMLWYYYHDEHPSTLSALAQEGSKHVRPASTCLYLFGDLSPYYWQLLWNISIPGHLLFYSGDTDRTNYAALKHRRFVSLFQMEVLSQQCERDHWNAIKRDDTVVSVPNWFPVWRMTWENLWRHKMMLLFHSADSIVKTHTVSPPTMHIQYLLRGHHHQQQQHSVEYKVDDDYHLALSKHVIEYDDLLQFYNDSGAAVSSQEESSSSSSSSLQAICFNKLSSRQQFKFKDLWKRWMTFLALQHPQNL